MLIASTKNCQDLTSICALARIVTSWQWKTEIKCKFDPIQIISTCSLCMSRISFA